VVYGASGIYTFVTVNVLGCDSVAILELTINSSTTSTSSVVKCDSSYLWNGINYLTTGIYSSVLVNSVGCDSTAFLNLTINNSTSSTTFITACDVFLWDGIAYATSGLYIDTLINVLGCDSIRLLNLTINNSSTSASSLILCDTTYLWNGVTYAVSGVYAYNSINSVGCDSTAFLNLIINSSSNSITFDTACDTYLWNGIVYDTTGVYDTTFVGANVLGCDSTAILSLTINSSANISSVAISFNISDYNSYNIRCNGESNGWVKVDVLGGTPPFLFDWSNSSNSDSIYNLSVGDYILSIVDDLGCSILDTVSLIEPEIISSNIVVLSDYNNYPISCFMGDDGVIMVTVQGGTPTYSLRWSDLENTDTLIDLSAGIII